MVCDKYHSSQNEIDKRCLLYQDSPNMQRLVEEGEDIDADMKPPAEALAEAAQELRKMPHRCCTLEQLKARPEIALWYIGNCLSYLGFYMPFLNLVSGLTSLLFIVFCYE